MLSSPILIILPVFLCHVLLTNVLKILFMTCGFPFPIFTTACHMAFSFLVVHWYIYVLKKWPDFKSVPWRLQLKLILPVATFQAMSLGLTNVGISLVYPSFVALVGTSGPIFTLLLAHVFRTEPLNVRWAYLSMVPVVAGTILNCETEAAFDMLGFFLLLTATFLRAAKIVLQTTLLAGNMQLDAISLLYAVAPWQFAIFFCWSLVGEGLRPISNLMAVVDWRAGPVLLATTIMAAMYNLLAFQSVKLLSGTMVMLLGQINVPCIAIVSWLLFGNHVSIGQGISILLTATGAYIFNTYGKGSKLHVYDAPEDNGTRGRGLESVLDSDDVLFDNDLSDERETNVVIGAKLESSHLWREQKNLV